MIQPRPDEFRSEDPGTFETASLGTEPSERFAKQTEQLGQQAKQKAGEALRQTGDSIREAGRQTKDQIVESTRRTSAQVQERASAVLADQKSRAADEVGVVGQALHRAADSLDENDQMMGRYVHQAADMVDSCADWLRDKSASEMVRGCGDFTRRHPEVVLGGLFLAGIAVARFLKASDRNRSLDESDFSRTDRDFEGNFGEGHYGALSDMDSPRSFEGGRGFGYEDAGYGDIGMYAGTQREMSDTGTSGFGGSSSFNEPRRSQIEDIPDIASSQPGSPSSLPQSQILDEPTLDAAESKPIRDDDLNTIGRNDPSFDNPSKPR